MDLSCSPEDLVYSVFLERVTSTTVHTDINTNPYSRPSLQWVPDEVLVKCYLCQATFTFYRRKHHCRLCLRGVCASCSPHLIVIPEILTPTTSIPPRTFILAGYFSKSKGVRVCNGCYIKVTSLRDSYPLFWIMSYLSLPDVLTMSRVSKEWSKAAALYKSFFREIQYRLPYLPLTSINRRILQNNTSYLEGHSRWMLQQLYLDPSSTSLSEGRRVKCWHLMCTRICNKGFTVKEVLEYLIWYTTKVTPPYLERFVEILDRLTVEELLSVLFPLIWSLQYSTSTTLLNLLIKRSIESIDFRMKGYWLLTVLKNIYPTLVPFYSTYITQLHLSLGEEVVLKHLIHSRKLLKLIAMMVAGPDNFFTIQSPLMPVPNPLCPTEMVVSIDMGKSRKIDSYTAPIVIPLSTMEGVHEVLLKRSNLFQDLIVVNAIRSMELILRQDLGIEFYVQTYEILPLDRDRGYIDIVPNALTLYEIKYQRNMSVAAYLYENNGEVLISELRDKFIKSTAFYSVISYLLGVGDRHASNILITKDGRLFHIDYGFIFGDDSKPLTPQIRLTHDILDMLGGERSESYRQFEKLSVLIYNTLRKYTNYIMSLLLPLTDPSLGCNLKREKLQEQLLLRLQPAQYDREAEATLQLIISESSRSYTLDIFDYCRHSTKMGLAKIWSSS